MGKILTPGARAGAAPMHEDPYRAPTPAPEPAPPAIWDSLQTTPPPGGRGGRCRAFERIAKPFVFSDVGPACTQAASAGLAHVPAESIACAVAAAAVWDGRCDRAGASEERLTWQAAVEDAARRRAREGGGHGRGMCVMRWVAGRCSLAFCARLGRASGAATKLAVGLGLIIRGVYRLRIEVVVNSGGQNRPRGLLWVGCFFSGGGVSCLPIGARPSRLWRSPRRRED